ncbi:hypothetical protein EDB86DRAFT_2829907 [Lactarius hatsudake]|nr:hypothetical protein EDB86DRAFT_2829907 [Lactarius hatsudake]
MVVVATSPHRRHRRGDVASLSSPSWQCRLAVVTVVAMSPCCHRHRGDVALPSSSSCNVASSSLSSPLSSTAASCMGPLAGGGGCGAQSSHVCLRPVSVHCRPERTDDSPLIRRGVLSAVSWVGTCTRRASVVVGLACRDMAALACCDKVGVRVDLRAVRGGGDGHRLKAEAAVRLCNANEKRIKMKETYLDTLAEAQLVPTAWQWLAWYASGSARWQLEDS